MKISDGNSKSRLAAAKLTARFLLFLGIITWTNFWPTMALANILSPQEIALRLEQKLKSVNTLRADFKQYYYSTTVQEPVVAHGQVFIRRPDRMRWEYNSPEKQIFLLKDNKFWLYFPEDNQLIKNAAESEIQESEILGLLSGNFSLQSRYEIGFNPFPTDQKNSYQLKLTPREESQFVYILLEIDRDSWLILKAVFFEPVGSKLEYQFSRIKINQKLSEELFELKIPPDCEIIEARSIKQSF
ncbi:MAG: LolA family protein [Candidatus Saccharicenans sp.]